MRSFLYTVLFVACSLFASGQSIRHIGAAEGLNNPTVYSIVQDDWGFVWIGTRDGLYKYNEGRARSFPFLDSTNFRRSNNVQSLLVTQDSVLLIGLQLGGIMGVDLESLRPISDSKIPQLPREVSIISLHQDSEGTIWAGSSGSGIFQLRQGSENWERFVSNEYAEDLKFIFDFEDQGDTLWIATSGDHLLYYLKAQSSVHAVEANKSVSSFRKSVDVSGGKVIFSVEGTGVFELSGGVFYQLAIPTKGTQRDAIFYEGNVWISTDGYGVYQWNGSTVQHFTKQDPTSGIITDQFYGIYEVYDELWLGTYNGGVAQFPVNSSAVSLLPKPKKFVASSIQSAISMVSDNDLWVGFDGDGLVRYRETESGWQPITFDNPLLPDVVTSLEFYQDELWIGSLGQGLFVMDTSGTIKEHFLAYSQ
ncbi:MAG: two-component regulator propeller domain-containing protein, partial [Schleiferiaceae bacterium]|nr:two-component regulator propeller domain-containing protein [Schleiferiaceae bacterium]